MLGDFIRLTDYVAVEALVNLTVRTNEMFLTELLKPRKAGLFETTVLFTDEGTAFAPTCDDIKVGTAREQAFLYGGQRGESIGTFHPTNTHAPYHTPETPDFGVIVYRAPSLESKFPSSPLLFSCHAGYGNCHHRGRD